MLMVVLLCVSCEAKLVLLILERDCGHLLVNLELFVGCLDVLGVLNRWSWSYSLVLS